MFETEQEPTLTIQNPVIGDLECGIFGRASSTEPNPEMLHCLGMLHPQSKKIGIFGNFPLSILKHPPRTQPPATPNKAARSVPRKPLLLLPGFIGCPLNPKSREQTSPRRSRASAAAGIGFSRRGLRGENASKSPLN